MPATLRCAFLVLLLACAPGARAEEALLRIAGPGRTVTLTAAGWAALPRTEVTAVEPHEKRGHRYAGVDARELLRRAGAPLEKELRGPAHRLGVLVRGRDGYAVLFALAEFDAAFSGRTLLLADRIDGAPLPEKAAPLQLIAPGDQRGARWVRMVSALEIVSIPLPP